MVTVSPMAPFDFEEYCLRYGLDLPATTWTDVMGRVSRLGERIAQANIDEAKHHLEWSLTELGEWVGRINPDIRPNFSNGIIAEFRRQPRMTLSPIVIKTISNLLSHQVRFYEIVGDLKAHADAQKELEIWNASVEDSRQ